MADKCIACKAVAVIDEVCTACGAASARRSGGGSAPVVRNTDQCRCAWIASDGQRCHYSGTMTDSTLGSERWYCRGHRFCHDRTLGDRIVEESRDLGEADHSAQAVVERAARAFVDRLNAPPPTVRFERKGDKRDWAREILARKEQGFPVSGIQEEFAQRALRIK